MGVLTKGKYITHGGGGAPEGAAVALPAAPPATANKLTSATNRCTRLTDFMGAIYDLWATTTRAGPCHAFALLALYFS
jgi:hypothetical protein